MRQPEEHSPGGARRFKLQFTKTARFASVVAAAGKPEVYLPLFDPTKDRSFMRAVREKRAPMVTGEDGRRALALAQAIADKMETV